jgi:EpsI family protein
MSVSNLPLPPPETRAATVRPRLGLWVRVGLACAVLVASGVVQSRQAVRVRGEIARGLTESFPLEEIPLTIGEWQGRTTELDEQIARLTGASQVITRRYVNQNTGVSLDVILLFGRAVDMYLHSPEICYPAAGFALSGGPDFKTIATPSGDAPFRSLVYAKGDGAAASRQEVYYTWRHNGRWSPDLGSHKLLERISGMYKVHIARSTTDREQRGVGNPSEAFLRVLLPEMNRRLAALETSPS